MRLFRSIGVRFLQVVFFLFAVTTWCGAQAFPGHWAGKWIWTEGEDHPYHYFLMARGDFDLAATPRKSTLKITASDRYILYLNGEYLGRGPARSDPRWKSYDVYEVGSRLHAGKNVIAVLAYHYGSQNNYSRDERAGLFAQLEVTEPDESQRVIGTGKDWRLRHAQAWRRDVELINMAVGITEVYNANLDPPDWVDPNFDDSGWEQAYVIPDVDCPWAYLEARRTPMMREEEVFPVQVVKVGEVVEIARIVNGFRERSPRITDVAERLASDLYFPLDHAKIEDLEAVLKADGKSARVQSFPFGKEETAHSGQRQLDDLEKWSPYIIVDFGRPLFGFPRVRLKGPEGVIVEMTYGPKLVQDRVYPILQGARYGDRYVTRAGEQTWQVFEYKQFRYLMIVFRNAPESIMLDSISVMEYAYPAEQRGRFECSDPILTGLWEAAIRTIYLSLEDVAIIDATRERRVFSGDGAHQLWAVWAGFGDLAISDWYFLLTSRGQTPDGLFRLFYPGTDTLSPDFGYEPPDKVATAFEVPGNIVAFSLFYVTVLGDYYRNFGKRELIEDLYPTLVELLGWFTRRADDSGLLYNLHNLQLIDWVDLDFRGANFETNALYYQSLMDMSEFARELGKPAEATRWKALADQVKASLREMHWNGERHLYVDSVSDGNQSTTVTETANGMALMYGIATADQVPEIVGQLADPDADMLRSTPLFIQYTFEGLMKAGAAEVALKQMRDKFAPMVEWSDTPTLWERWSWILGSDTGSVHGGAAGVAWTLSTHVLGVHTEGVAFQKCRIEPNTGWLNWARGVVPSVRGDIEVEWKKKNQAFIMDVRLPAGLESSLVMARNASNNLRLLHNGRQFVIPAGAQSVPGLQISKNRIVVPVVGGIHHLELATE